MSQLQQTRAQSTPSIPPFHARHSVAAPSDALVPTEPRPSYPLYSPPPTTYSMQSYNQFPPSYSYTAQGPVPVPPSHFIPVPTPITYTCYPPPPMYAPSQMQPFFYDSNDPDPQIPQRYIDQRYVRDRPSRPHYSNSSPYYR